MKTLVHRGNEIWENHSLASFWRFLFLVLLFLYGSAPAVWAQTKQWDKTLGGNATEDFTSMVVTPDGGYLLGGTSTSGVSGDKTQTSRGQADYWIVKVNSSGNIVWNKTIGTSGYDYFEDLIATPDGGYLVGGSTFSDVSGDKTEKSKGSFDYWLVKLDAAGNKMWDKTLGGSNYDYFQAVVPTQDGGYLVGGTSFSGKSGDKSQAGRGGLDRDYWVIKIDENGKKVWDKTITGDSDDRLMEVMATPDGGFLLGGNSYSDIGYDKTGESRGVDDYWVVKLDSTGTQVWDNTFGGASTDNIYSLALTQDGGYLLGGYSDSGVQGDKTASGKGGSDLWIIKVDANGAKVWDKTFGSRTYDYFADLIALPGGGYMLGGTTSGGIGGDKTQITRGGQDYWVVKINETGNKVWDRTFGGKNSDELQTLLSTPDGGYLLGGSSFSGISGEKSAAGKGERDYWVVKVEEDNFLDAQWNFRYGGSGKDGFATLIRTADSGFLFGGSSSSDNSGDRTQPTRGKSDFWIVKTDESGKKIWDRRYGGPSDDYLNSVIQTVDGGYLLGGTSLSGVGGDKTQAGRGERDYWVIKVNSEGVKVWDKRFGGSGVDDLKQVFQLPSGRYILAGTSNSTANGDKTQGTRGGQDYWVIKLNNNGAMIWDKRYGGSLNDALESIAPTLDDGFLLGGSSFSGISGDRTQSTRGSADYWVVRINADGDVVWDKRYGGSGVDNLMSLGSTGTATGNFFIAGHSTSGVGGDKTQSNRGGKDFWMIKISGDGDKLWDSRFGGDKDEGLRSIIITADGGYLLGGRSESDISGDKTQKSQGGSDYWIVKTNSVGVKQWDKRFGGNAYDEIRAVLQTPDGGYLLGGRSDSGISGDRTQASQGSTDYWLVKVAPEVIEAPTTVTAPTTIVSAANLSESKVVEASPSLSVKAYPNPFQGKVTVQFTLPQTQPTQVKVYDIQGKETAILFQGEAQANQTYQVEWQADKQAAGMYLLQLQTPFKRSQYKLMLSR
ncbi:T9SS type A sorting domain-containing protein [Adhaeribacter radiodurans]|uniref:T9SS type A sorting domain-containing protein n=1 Tax=Adhaeribacter radiodurans TaxID=2745197 RepID=A0A7L7LDY1_9BACT|nr:T9SS type A sorting domain-containing protein [Adhaeribacter radiodurans]QMU31038.1 T9SS type A sorting domain-containing protein [Adhaeribacter radiodurans]